MAIARDNTPERLVSAARADEEQNFELKLRPRWLREFIGQSKAKEQLAIALEAAKSRGEALDHVLLFGPPGLGKTTLATIIANELDVGFQQTSGPALQIQGDLTAILTNLRERQVLFLDEIHRMQPVLEEKLYAALNAAAPEELLVLLKEHAARELAPYRARMGVVQLRQVEHQFAQKQLLVHYNLPRLSLFYMSQQ